MTSPDFARGDLELTGMVASASNAVYQGVIGGRTVVYKPVAGERPLWDFPDGTLAQREVAAYLVSEAIGWNIVPCTWISDGPAGEGMLQLWQDEDPLDQPVDLIAPADLPETGWRHVFDGFDEHDREVALVHEDSAALRRMAVFDVITNNADRKAGHILAVPGGHRYGIDHGLTFHEEHKLRTVLWGWRGEDLLPDERAGVQRALDALDGELADRLAELLTDDEIIALGIRCERMLARGRFPSPSGQRPAVPWPLF